MNVYIITAAFLLVNIWGCATVQKPVVDALKHPIPSVQTGVWKDLPGWAEDDFTQALPALLVSCQSLQKQAKWKEICLKAQNLRSANALILRDFFQTYFIPHQVSQADGSRTGLITGYYEPILRGSRERSAAYSYPLYGVPDDLLVVDLAAVYPELKPMRLRGRLVGRKVVPYYSRAELDDRAAQLQRNVLFWISDPIDLFFMQIQGSGQIQLSNHGETGERVRVAYAEHNGHPYRSIGRALIDQGALKFEQASAQGIKAWARAHPARLKALLYVNPSYVFFRELDNTVEGPVGAMNLPLTAGRSIAVDPQTIPLGSPVFLATTWPNSKKAFQRLMFAQDTGGAIKGAVRADVFWGSGTEAGKLAGKARQQGQMWVLLPSP